MGRNSSPTRPDQEATAAGPGLHLEVLSGGRKGLRRRFAPGELRVGRHPSCELCLDGHLDRAVSSEHLRVAFDGTRWEARDAGSTNGTLLNGTPLQGPAPLRPGDTLELGRLPERGAKGTVLLRVDVEGQQDATRVPPPASAPQTEVRSRAELLADLEAETLELGRCQARLEACLLTLGRAALEEPQRPAAGRPELAEARALALEERERRERIDALRRRLG